MDNIIINQLYSLVIYLICGIIIGTLFDTFRALRKTFRTSDIVTYIEDFVFWIMTGLILIFVFFNFSDGQIRIYNLIGLLIGTISYMILLSKSFIKISVIVLKFIKITIYKILKILVFPIKFIINLLKKVFKPFTFFVININKHIFFF